MNCLGIDFGTTSVKAVLFDEKLNELATFSEEYTLNTRGNIVELVPEKYWELLQNALNAIRAKAEIHCLAIDTQCETLILTDEDGNAVRDAIVWLDNRATAEAEDLEKQFGRQKVYEVTGQPEVTATWPACKLLWVKRNEPEVWAKTKKVFLLEDYLLYRLTGEFVTEKTLQSSTIYFDIHHDSWWKEMLDAIGVEESMLPALLNSGKLVGEYEGIKVVTSAMDQVAAAVGAGVIHKGIVSVMTGTTMAIYLPTDAAPEFDPGSFVPCHYSFDGKFCLLSWSPTAGLALKWFRETFLEKYSFEIVDNNIYSSVRGIPNLCVFSTFRCSNLNKDKSLFKFRDAGFTFFSNRRMNEFNPMQFNCFCQLFECRQWLVDFYCYDTLIGDI